MFSFIIKKKREFEVQQLSKDASAVIDQAQKIFGEQGVREITQMVESHMVRLGEQYSESDIDLKRFLIDLRRTHKEARRQNDQRLLSALTIVIIFVEAKLVEADTSLVSKKIRSFLVDPYPINKKP